MKPPIKLLFIIPYLSQNTTSINRIHSIILDALQRNDVEVKILYYDFSTLNKASIGIDGEQLNIPDLIKNNTLVLNPSLNFLQVISFWLIKKNLLKLYKLSTLLHQLVYSADVFAVYKINEELPDLNLNKNDYVIALGGPFGIFKTALIIKNKYDCKLVIDYRDPWTYGYPPIDGSYLFHLYKQRIIRKEENRILSKAKNVFTVSDSLKNFFPNKFQSKVFVIPNAANYQEVNVNTSPKTFNIIYLGTIYDIQLTDHTFFKVFSKWIIDKPKVNLIFLGSNNNILLKKIIELYELVNYTSITKRLSKENLQQYLENASIFLQFKYGDRKEIITSKQADYLIYRKPILLPVSDLGDIAESIYKNKAGYVCNKEDEVLSILDNLYKKFLLGSIETIPESSSNKTNNREYWAKEFIDKILTTPPNSELV